MCVCVCICVCCTGWKENLQTHVPDPVSRQGCSCHRCGPRSPSDLHTHRLPERQGAEFGGDRKPAVSPMVVPRRLAHTRPELDYAAWTAPGIVLNSGTHRHDTVSQRRPWGLQGQGRFPVNESAEARASACCLGASCPATFGGIFSRPRVGFPGPTLCVAATRRHVDVHDVA